MFVRLKNASTDKEVNIITTSIAYFEPAGDGTGSTIHLLNGVSLTVKESNRAVRFAINKSATAGNDSDGDQA
jgi:hypothetical protein